MAIEIVDVGMDVLVSHKGMKYTDEYAAIKELRPGQGFVWTHGLAAAGGFVQHARAKFNMPGLGYRRRGDTIWIVYAPDINGHASA